MRRVRMVRNIAHRLDLREGVVCEVSAEDAERFIAARLAEPVDDPAAAPSATTDPAPATDPAATPAVGEKPGKKTRSR